MKDTDHLEARRPPMSLLIVLSAASGAVALTYEIVWFQSLELFLGSTTVSLSVILATFMGGTCLGSFLLPRMVSAKRNPLRVYAAIEAGIGASGLLMLFLIPFAGSIYTAWSGYGWIGFLLRGIAAAGCLLLPTLLMGATLPALARRIPPAANGVASIGFLYSTNIAGSVLGCLLSGFYLLREYDVGTATLVAAATNAVIAFLAWAGSRSENSNIPSATPASTPTSATLADSHVPNAGIYTAIALSGFCALAAESIWTRLLGLLLGASVYTFSIILAVFLTGLGVGSSMGSLLARSLTRPRLAFGYLQVLLIGAVAWTAYSLSASLPYWPVNPSISTDIWFNFQIDLDRAFWALLPPTLLWGASFPLAIAALNGRGQDTGRWIAGIYASNTLGAILGAVGANWVLVPALGSPRAQQLLILLSAASALVLLLPGELSHGVAGFRRAGMLGSLAAVVATPIFVSIVPPLSKLLVAHGRFAATWIDKSDIVYAAEGLNSSVAVSRFPGGALTFHVAGKIQASNVPRDLRLQRMLGHLTTLTAAQPKSVLVIGCGAGVTAGAVSIDPNVEHVAVVEIEPLVPQAAAAYFSETNFDVVRNPKVEVHIDDGRHYLFTTSEKFDAITADPLDPWVKGAANLYTQEFYEEAKKHLNPGGTITMYIQLFETNLDAVRSAVATFFEVFPNGTVWGNPYEGQGHDMVLLGRVEPLQIDLDEMQSRLEKPAYEQVSASLKEVGMESSMDLFATYAGRAADLHQWLSGAPINRDRNLRMQYLAGEGLNLDDSPSIYSSMLTYRRFPSDIFVSSEGRVESLREQIDRSEP